MKEFRKIIVDFLFVALIFYLLYVSLWVFCPCGESQQDVTHNEHAEMTNN